jgi:hypothetical protein
MDIFVSESQCVKIENDEEMVTKNFSSCIAVTAFCGCIGGALYMIDITPRQDLLSDEQAPLDLGFYGLDQNFNDALINCLRQKKVYAILLNGKIGLLFGILSSSSEFILFIARRVIFEGKQFLVHYAGRHANGSHTIQNSQSIVTEI